MHLVPDARCRGSYAIPPSVPLCAPAAQLPPSYRLVKSASFVIGWAMIGGGILVAAITCGADILIWNNFQATLPRETGKVFSESEASVLWAAAQIAKTTSVTCLLSAAAAAIGAVLIQISQRLRWRLLDENEKEELRKSIQQGD